MTWVKGLVASSCARLVVARGDSISGAEGRALDPKDEDKAEDDDRDVDDDDDDMDAELRTSRASNSLDTGGSAVHGG